MEPELFTPSYDWAAAPLDSLLWIGKAWVISAVVSWSRSSCCAMRRCGVGSSGASPAATSSGRSRFGCG